MLTSLSGVMRVRIGLNKNVKRKKPNLSTTRQDPIDEGVCSSVRWFCMCLNQTKARNKQYRSSK